MFYPCTPPASPRPGPAMLYRSIPPACTPPPGPAMFYPCTPRSIPPASREEGVSPPPHHEAETRSRQQEPQITETQQQ